jgi:hypothetical protein
MCDQKIALTDPEKISLRGANCLVCGRRCSKSFGRSKNEAAKSASVAVMVCPLDKTKRKSFHPLQKPASWTCDRVPPYFTSHHYQNTISLPQLSPNEDNSSPDAVICPHANPLRDRPVLLLLLCQDPLDLESLLGRLGGKKRENESATETDGKQTSSEATTRLEAADFPPVFKQKTTAYEVGKCCSTSIAQSLYDQLSTSLKNDYKIRPLKATCSN